MAIKAALIEFLASTRVHPTSGLAWEGGLIGFFVPGTSTGKAVWLNRDKTLPTTAGQATGTLGADGSFTAYGDGIYDIKIYESSDTTLTTPLKTFSSVNVADATLNATLTDPDFLDGTDATKVASWDMATISSGTTRTFTLPDESGDIVTSTAGVVTKDVTGDLTGNVTGDVTGDLTGNADTATSLNYTVTTAIDSGGYTINTSLNAKLSLVLGAVTAGDAVIVNFRWTGTKATGLGTETDFMDLTGTATGYFIESTKAVWQVFNYMPSGTATQAGSVYFVVTGTGTLTINLHQSVTGGDITIASGDCYMGALFLKKQ